MSVVLLDTDTLTVGAAGLPYGVTALDEALHGPQPTALQARSWNV